MKQLVITMIVLSAITFAACNNGGNTKEKNDMPAMNSDSANKNATTDDKDVKEITPTFASVDATVAGYLKNIVDHYLHIKNALANDNGSEAANGGKMLSQALAEVDMSFFASDQKKVYDGIEEDLKEHAEHIGKNGDNIKHQREHFSMMSEDVYDLVKAFGGGRALYHDHCPMYNDNKGAMWLSELKDIKNPYMGKEMTTCGSLEEKIK
jgi:Protein of unknown function (DUF3347)